MIKVARGMVGNKAIAELIKEGFNNSTINNLHESLPLELHMLGHPMQGSHRIHFNLLDNNSVQSNQRIVNFISHYLGWDVFVGVTPRMDGQGLRNWISFRRDVRQSDPRNVAKVGMLLLLQIHNLIHW